MRRRDVPTTHDHVPNHWPLVHLRSDRDPRQARCGRYPLPSLLTGEWGDLTCGACLVPYRPGPLDPRTVT